MKILLVDQYSEIGGAQRCLLSLVPAFQDRGWSLLAALPGDGPMSQRLTEMGVPVSFVPCGPYTSGNKTISDFAHFLGDTRRAAQAFQRIVAEHRVDVIYVNGPRMLASARLGGAPILFHAHNRLTRWHDLLVLRWALARATVIASSEFVAQPLRRYSSPVIIPNGTEDLGFRAGRSELPLRIGVVGRIAPEKGQLQFVEAVGHLFPHHRNWRFVICGDDILSRPGHKELVLRAGGNLPIEFTGWRETPSDAIREVDVLVVPSTHDDATPRVILEAFSAGVPVVAFAAGGIPELVTDDQTGYLVPECTAQALAERLIQVLADPDRMRTVTLEARKLWQRCYSIGRFRDQVTAFMEETVPRRRNQNISPATAASKPAAPRVTG